MPESNLSIINLIPPLIFFILNVFIPGPNVLNTIATSMGSGRISGIACAAATGAGVFLVSLISLFGATIIFYRFPLIYKSLTLVGCFFLIYFAKSYLSKVILSNEQLIVLQNIDSKIAFKQAFLVLLSNPKMMTTFLAVMSLFPIVASNFKYAIIFSILTGISSFSGHLIFATIFSTHFASKLYMRLYKPINAIVGVGFIFYSVKLLLNIL
tara:strand:- start:331 stop:963 length:633 start_codon:yes stop_codon:yes gene_type:complete